MGLPGMVDMSVPGRRVSSLRMSELPLLSWLALRCRRIDGSWLGKSCEGIIAALAAMVVGGARLLVGNCLFYEMLIGRIIHKIVWE